MIGFLGFELFVNTSVNNVGLLGLETIIGSISGGGGGGGGGGTGGNVRKFPEPDGIRFFPNNLARKFPVT